MKNLIKHGLLTVYFVLLPMLMALAQPIWKPGKANITFTIRNGGFGVDGSLSGFAGALTFDSAMPETARLSATVETATLNTGNNIRDGHLKKSDYFDVAAHPRISLKSTEVIKTGPNIYLGTFDLTMKGVTRAVQIPFTFFYTSSGGQFVGQFTLDRVAYGVGSKSFILSRTVAVKLTINVQLVGLANVNQVK